MMNKLILLDYGGVLGYDHLIEKEKILANSVGLTITELNNRVSEKSSVGKDFRENKISEKQFWRLVAKDNTIEDHTAHILTNMWMDTYCLNNSMMDYLQQLRQKFKVGVLTNIDASRSKLLEKILNIDVNLDYYFPSYIFGYSKDDSQLWNLINKKIKMNDNIVNVIYVDDREEHVVSAEKIGWIGIKYINLEKLKSQISLFEVKSPIVI